MGDHPQQQQQQPSQPTTQSFGITEAALKQVYPAEFSPKGESIVQPLSPHVGCSIPSSAITLQP